MDTLHQYTGCVRTLSASFSFLFFFFFGCMFVACSLSSHIRPMRTCTGVVTPFTIVSLAPCFFHSVPSFLFFPTFDLIVLCEWKSRLMSIVKNVYMFVLPPRRGEQSDNFRKRSLIVIVSRAPLRVKVPRTAVCEMSYLALIFFPDVSKRVWCGKREKKRLKKNHSHAHTHRHTQTRGSHLFSRSPGKVCTTRASGRRVKGRMPRIYSEGSNLNAISQTHNNDKK